MKAPQMHFKKIYLKISDPLDVIDHACNLMRKAIQMQKSKLFEDSYYSNQEAYQPWSVFFESVEKLIEEVQSGSFGLSFDYC